MSFIGERPVTGNAPGTVSAVNLSQIAGTTTSVNNGAADAGTQRVAVAPNTAAAPFNVTGATAPLVTSQDWKYAAASGGITDTADVVLHAAPGASLYNVIQSVQIINTDLTVGTEVVIKSAATIIWRGFAPASITAVTQPSMVNITFSPPLACAANEAANAACITTSSQTYINAQGTVVG